LPGKNWINAAPGMLLCDTLTAARRSLTLRI
jgi:hypothetical protein